MGNSECSKMGTATYTFPEDFDEPTKEFISRCLECDPNKRLESSKELSLEEEMFRLEFFKDVDTKTIHQQANRLIYTSLRRSMMR